MCIGEWAVLPDTLAMIGAVMRIDVISETLFLLRTVPFLKRGLIYSHGHMVAVRSTPMLVLYLCVHARVEFGERIETGSSAGTIGRLFGAATTLSGTTYGIPAARRP